jgi:hypothetical protein
MIFQCPVTGITWGAAPRSNLQLTLLCEHPMLGQPLEIVSEQSRNWARLTTEDKKLLWVAALRANPLMVIRGKIRPSDSLVEGTFASLLGLTLWVRLQREPEKFLPSFVPNSESCSNVLNYLIQLTYEKHEWQESRDAYKQQLAEADEVAQQDRKLERYRLSQKIDNDKLPASLVNWLLAASEAPSAMLSLWKSFLCSSKEQVLLNKLSSLASLDECLEHLECWEHPTLVKHFAIKQLREKIKFYNENSLDGKASLDFLITAPSSRQTPKNKLFELDLGEATPVLADKRAELASSAAQRLAAIKAAKQQSCAEGTHTSDTNQQSAIDKEVEL